MSGPPGLRPRLLLVGGGGGLVGRALLREFAPDWQIRSVHRHSTPEEAIPSVEWVSADVATLPSWRPVLDGVDVVINVAWYRSGPDRRFRPLAEGLRRLVADARAVGVRRFVQISVPIATDHIETTLPYMVRKREVDRAIVESGIPYTLVRPTMLFGPRDVLLTVMLRTMARWHRFPIFEQGEYRVSPISVRDLARIVRREASLDGARTETAGGPRTWRYRELTDRLFEALGLPPRYFRLSARGGERLAYLLETLGSTLLYAYEVEWLVSDRLGLPPYEGLDTPLEPVEPFLDSEGMRLRPRRPNG
jgi:NADH dehydrogenase